MYLVRVLSYYYQGHFSKVGFDVRFSNRFVIKFNELLHRQCCTHMYYVYKNNYVYLFIVFIYIHLRYCAIANFRFLVMKGNKWKLKLKTSFQQCLTNVLMYTTIEQIAWVKAKPKWRNRLWVSFNHLLLCRFYGLSFFKLVPVGAYQSWDRTPPWFSWYFTWYVPEVCAMLT